MAALFTGTLTEETQRLMAALFTGTLTEETQRLMVALFTGTLTEETQRLMVALFTGTLTEETQRLMARDRCGVPDVTPDALRFSSTRRRKRYALHGEYPGAWWMGMVGTHCAVGRRCEVGNQGYGG